MKKHVIFDFDGTLVDTNQLIVNSWQAVYRHYTGAEGSLEEIYATFGDTLYDSMAEVFPDADQAEAIEIYRGYQRENYKEEIAIFPGIRELLQALADRGVTVSIVTARLKEPTLEYLDVFGLKDIFEEIITVEDTDKHKPDPEPLLIALDRLGAKPEEALMIGDTKCDVGCANNAGVDSVLAAWSKVADEETLIKEGYPPKYIIDEPLKLIDLL